MTYSDSVLERTSSGETRIARRWHVGDSCGASQDCVQLIATVQGHPRVAVLPLENLSSSDDGPRVVMRLIENEIQQRPDWDLIPAGDVESALLRLRIRQPVLMDNGQTNQLTEAVSAHLFVVGSVLSYETTTDQFAGVIPMVSVSLQLRDAIWGTTLWSDTFHAVGSDGEWLFGLGVDHDITRVAKALTRKAVEAMRKTLSNK